MKISYETGKRIIPTMNTQCIGYRCRYCGAEANVKLADIMQTPNSKSYTFECPKLSTNKWSCQVTFTVPMYNLVYHILKMKMRWGRPSPHPASKRFEQLNEYAAIHNIRLSDV